MGLPQKIFADKFLFDKTRSIEKIKVQRKKYKNSNDLCYVTEERAIKTKVLSTCVT